MSPAVRRHAAFALAAIVSGLMLLGGVGMAVIVLKAIAAGMGVG